MSEFKVFCEKVKLLPHSNAERLDVAKIGNYSLVIQKGNYADGDRVVFAPKLSILPDEIKSDYCNSETGISYLSGPESNRVKSVRLRGEPSEGVTLNPQWVIQKLGVTSLDEIPLGEDLSANLGITKWEIPIPSNFAGQLKQIDTVAHFKKHDVESMKLYQNEFVDELVTVHEKIHGSQINILRDSDGKQFVTSKGMASKNLSILEDDKNIYWKAVRNTGIFDIIAPWKSNNIQIMAEVLPCQNGYSYGQDSNKPTLRIFRFIADNIEYSQSMIDFEFKSSSTENSDIWKKILDLWVPVLYHGPFDITTLVELSKGMEQVSGKQLHIREGVVVSPVLPRRSSEGFWLYLKVINPAYAKKETGEEIN